MEVNNTEYKNCDLITANGRIDSSTAPQLGEAMEAITENGRYKIVFDLSGVEYMSSAGLRILISTQKTCQRNNRGEVILACIPQRVYDALDLAGFVPLFTIYDSVMDAVGNI
ncbi:MAG: STAS domain-containing protein [Chloroflexota bacterium]|jgi:anti-sigma B factor antagonist|nr:STAS domain-containing protein [Chloroflexota bacterium]